MAVDYAELRRIASGEPRNNPPTLTTKDGSTVDGTYGNEERDVIQNNRTRIEEIEDALDKMGIVVKG